MKVINWKLQRDYKYVIKDFISSFESITPYVKKFIDSEAKVERTSFKWQLPIKVDWHKEIIELEYKNPTAVNQRCSRLVILRQNEDYHSQSTDKFYRDIEDKFLIAISDEYSFDQQVSFLQFIVDDIDEDRYLEEWKKFLLGCLWVFLTTIAIFIIAFYLYCIL